MINELLGGGRRITVPCTIDVEHTPESLHAYVELDGVEVGPGDEVIVHGAPGQVLPGERAVYRGEATVVRAGPLERLRMRLAGYLQLTELYEVGFEGRA